MWHLTTDNGVMMLSYSHMVCEKLYSTSNLVSHFLKIGKIAILAKMKVQISNIKKTETYTDCKDLVLEVCLGLEHCTKQNSS